MRRGGRRRGSPVRVPPGGGPPLWWSTRATAADQAMAAGTASQRSSGLWPIAPGMSRAAAGKSTTTGMAIRARWVLSTRAGEGPPSGAGPFTDQVPIAASRPAQPITRADATRPASAGTARLPGRRGAAPSGVGNSQRNNVSNRRDSNRHPPAVSTNSSVSSPTTAGTAGPSPSPSWLNTVSKVLPVARPSPQEINRIPEQMCRVRTDAAARARPHSWMASCPTSGVPLVSRMPEDTKSSHTRSA